MSEKDIDEALREAWEEADVEEDSIHYDDENETLEEEDELGEESSGDEEERPAEEPEEESATAAPEESESSEDTDVEGDTENTQQVESSIKAPVGWSPAAREHWSKLPPEVQAQVNKREKDIANKVQEAALATKGFEEFQNATAPYQQFFAAEGVSAAQATANLMQTAAGLRVGTPQQKASIVREIITNFGVDIGMLDTMLSGQQVAQTGEDSHLQTMLQQQLAPIQSFMQEVQQQRQNFQETTSRKAQAELEAFAASHEFFEDLRMDMADISDMASRRGQNLSLEECYQRAAQMHPEIGPILAQREKARTPTTDVAAKKRAASSVSGSPGRKQELNADEMSLEDTMRAAWDGEL